MTTTPEDASDLSGHRVLTREDAKALGREIARAAGRPETQDDNPSNLPPNRAQQGEESSRSHHRR